MKYFFAFLFVYFTLFQNLQAQNLVPNAGFEQYIGCPNAASLINNASGWSTYNQGTPDYYHTCGSNGYGIPQTFGGYQLPAKGNAFAGVIIYAPSVNWKEYLLSTLNAPMQAGCAYEVSMSVSLPDKEHYATDDLGIYFFKNAPTYVNTITPLPVTPQVSYSNYGPITDTAHWIRLNAVYIPDSAYDHIVIGGFKDSSTVNLVFLPGGVLYGGYYFIDSVMVRKLPLSLQFGDTVLCQGDVINVPYTTLACAAFSSGNSFTLQLSDSSGSFAKPVNIGAVTSASPGNIQGTIPANTPAGYHYRLRIKSNSPIDSSLDNGFDIRIGTPVTAGSNSPVCAGGSLQLTALNSLPGTGFSWSGPLSFSSSQQNPPISNVTAANSGVYTVTAMLNGCPATDTVHVSIKPTPVVTASTNTPVCAGTDVLLHADSDISGSSYNWNGPSYNSQVKDPVIQKAGKQQAGLYRVTAIFNQCFSKPDTVEVIIKDVPPAPYATDTTICRYAQQVQLHADGDSIRWYDKAGTMSSFTQPVIPTSDTTPQIFYVTQTINGCESDKTSLTISFTDKPDIELGKDVEICHGTTVKIGVEKQNVNYAWNTGATQCCISIDTSGTYIETVSNICGTTSDSVTVTTIACKNCMYFPSAFTPNGDGLNDTWGGIASCPFKKFTIKIYNRWSNLVYESHNPADRWDGIYKGNPATGDTYSFFVEFTTDIPGRTYTTLLKGNVTLIR